MAERQVLIVMRAAEMKRIHPQTDFTRRCSKCGEEVGIYPSGQEIIRQFGEKNVAVICNRCVRPEQLAVAESAPGVQQEVAESIPKPPMASWTVYHNPRDFPGKYVIRRFDIFPGTSVPTAEHYVADTLEGVRRHVPPGLIRLPRFDNHPELGTDEPQIVEVWL